MPDDDGTSKKGQIRWNSSYSAMTMEEAEKRLGTRLWKLKVVSVESLLGPVYKARERENTKKKVYDRLVEYLEIEGYPTEANEAESRSRT